MYFTKIQNKDSNIYLNWLVNITILFKKNNTLFHIFLLFYMIDECFIL